MSGLFCSPASPVVRPPLLLPLEAPLLDPPLPLLPLLALLPPLLDKPPMPEALAPPLPEAPLLAPPLPEAPAPLLPLPPLLCSDPSPNPPVEGLELQAKRESTSDPTPIHLIVFGAG
jgi:hypothetical protein